MTVQTGPADHQPAAPPPGAWYPEDEIDLREYILVLVAWWREIVLIALVAAIVGAGAVLALRLLQAPSYEASALVAISRVRSDITFEERFITESGEEPTGSNDGRRLALVGLVSSSAVAETVIDQVGDLLTEEERSPAVLLESVNGELASIGDSRGTSDLIRITARADSPEKAAAIANAWAQTYVDHTNRLYGDVPNELLASVQTELANAQTAYDEAQNRLESFIASSDVNRLERLIAQKQATITSLQESRQEAVRQFLAAYNQALSENRLLAFTKEQEAKRQLLSAYIDAEVENRIAAFENDRAARQIIYDRLVQTELDSLTAVLDEQVAAALSDLNRAYTERQRMTALLADAQGLSTQIAEGGDAAVQTNALPLTLLKMQVFAAVEEADLSQGSNLQSRTLPGNLQLNLESLPGADVTVAEQQADVTALVQVLQERITALDELIAVQSQELASGDVYQFVEALDPALLAVSGAEVGEDASPLQQAILQRYQDLYGVGSVAEANQLAAQDTELFTNIQNLYSQLFESDALVQLSRAVQEEGALALLDEEQIQSLLLINPEDGLSANVESEGPLVRAIQELEREIQELDGALESEAARRQRLTQERDLTRSTLATLQNKAAELSLSSTTANSEVRFAVPAVPPLDPVAGPSLITTTALAGIVGLMLAVFVAFLANFLGGAPFFSRRTAAETS